MSTPSTSESHPPKDHSRWFAEEVHAHEPSLRAYIRGTFPAMRDVEDVVQESYLRVWKARIGQPIRSSKSFLFEVARNLARDFLRRERVAPFVPVSTAVIEAVCDERRGVSETACMRDEVDFLVRAIDAMPPRLREVMLLRKIDGLSQKEIAARLGLSESTVQLHVVRGLRRLEDFFRVHRIGRRLP